MAFINSSEIVDNSAYGVSGRSQFYVGLDNCIDDLRRLLFKSELSVVGLQCMGGGEKSTLALALFNDPQIKGYFRDNVILFTVSKSPNLQGILETMCEKIAGQERPEFQNLKEARTKLQQLILNQSKPTLVILDDVWSRADLENLLFEGPGYKTLVTTRDDSIIPTTATTQLYEVPLLCREEAVPVSGLSGFGQPSNPSTSTVNSRNIAPRDYLAIDALDRSGAVPLLVQQAPLVVSPSDTPELTIEEDPQNQFEDPHTQHSPSERKYKIVIQVVLALFGASMTLMLAMLEVIEKWGRVTIAKTISFSVFLVADMLALFASLAVAMMLTFNLPKKIAWLIEMIMWVAAACFLSALLAAGFVLMIPAVKWLVVSFIVVGAIVVALLIYRAFIFPTQSNGRLTIQMSQQHQGLIVV